MRPARRLNDRIPSQRPEHAQEAYEAQQRALLNAEADLKVLKLERAKLVKALRDLHEHCGTRSVFSTSTVKGIRADGKFIGAYEAAGALLRELGEEG